MFMQVTEGDIFEICASVDNETTLERDVMFIFNVVPLVDITAFSSNLLL